MRWIIALVVIVILGAIIGPMASGNAGYVLVQFAGVAIETTVVGLIVVAIVTATLLTVIVSLLRRLLSKTRQGRKWLANRSERKAQTIFQQGIRELLNDEPQKAAESFSKAYKKSPDKNTAALTTLACCLNKDAGKATFWQDEAGTFYEDADTLLQLVVIEQQVKTDPSQADKTIQSLLTSKPHSANALKLAYRVFKASGNWQQLKELLPELRQVTDLPPAEFERLEYQVYFERFVAEGRRSNEILYNEWRSLSSKLRSDSTIRLSYAAALKHLGDHEPSARVILKGLRRGDLQPSAVNSLHLFNAKSEKLLEFVQAQLKQNPQDRDYLYALAQIAMDNQDFSLAQRALKKLTEIEPSSRVYRLLGDAYHALGDSQLAANAYKEALAH
ncbi:heme biosynthesis HemY N-terminal domain-containing protein [Idiomarina sp. HP20-50]|uniref:heme biosynthesis HemY N-terminal domain-containing protein n=1 Tax=Idiomarina sp. HP20-50 TaxID=3070813 RepID=UPI00294AE486|nr:heme biosynthesis HemY N-terminal domain-containing protein [Idiomarina sp. HP20-50]MDV6316547.1 heme biosynthesis HemY N-terminal domain-containing protein [Idiomarina sp. HP20-50]